MYVNALFEAPVIVRVTLGTLLLIFVLETVQTPLEFVVQLEVPLAPFVQTTVTTTPDKA